MLVQKNAQTLKYVCLLTLTLQNAVLGLSMRYSRIRPGNMFVSSTAVLLSEVVKLLLSMALVFHEEGCSWKKLRTTLHQNIIRNPVETLKVCVPSLLYIVQNNFLYVSASHLDAATYQVTYQLKILTTAMFAVCILKKHLLSTQWLALLLLIAGIVLVQLVGDSAPSSVNNIEQKPFLGFCAAIGACVLSGFAGIYFEKILKGSDVSVWMRNVQLSFCSLPFGLATCLINDGAHIRENGFLYGYDSFIAYLVVLQAGGGLLVALVVKHADNILKGFATSLAIIISCLASIVIFDFHLTVQFSAGCALVIGSIFLYGHTPAAGGDLSKMKVRHSEDKFALLPRV